MHIKKEDIKKLREKTADDLKKDLQKDKDNLWNAKKDLASGKVKNISEIHRLKKTIAAINTLLKEKMK